jgi:hypothetical protein
VVTVSNEPTLRSPNELLAAAVELELGGRKPSSREDWHIVMNFFAYNVLPAVAEKACILLRTIYDMPLTDQEVRDIADFQLRNK